MLEPGQVVDGRFEVESLLGEGGLAAVYRVRHSGLGSVHALKLLTWRKKSLAERLILEGRIQAQLNHPNIVAVTDLVRHDGQLGLLMEYVDHQSLEEYLGSQGGLGLEGGLEMLAPILSAVAAAHDLGVTHRDLKPDNILLANSPKGLVPKVTDFGIAKVVAELAGHSTAVGSTMGTPGYLAPEQMKDSSGIDARADIFALGAIGWELITGHRAFGDEQGNLTVLATTERTAPPLERYIGACPEHIEAALQKAMAKEPDERFEDCHSFARALFAEHPRLLAEVEGNVSTTSTLALGGIRQTLEKSLTSQDPTIQPVPAPTTEAPLEEPAGTPPWIPLVALLLVGGAMMAFAMVQMRPAGAPPAEDVAPVALAPSPPAVAPAPPPAPVEPQVEPVVSEPTVAPAPLSPPVVQQLEPAPAPEPDVEPAPDPEPEVEPAPAPESTTLEAPPENPPVEPEPAPVVPVPTETQAVVAALPPEPEPSLPSVAGTWVGKAAKRPLELRISMGEDGGLSGRAVFTIPRPRDEPLSGTVDPSGSVRFRVADLLFTGRAQGGTMSGTYRRDGGGKAQPWSVSR